MNKYRILNIWEDTTRITGEKVAVVELSEIDVNGGFKISGDQFIFPLNSVASKILINYAKKVMDVHIDLGDFEHKVIRDPSGLKNQYYFDGVLNKSEKNEDLLIADQNELVEEYLLYHHADMYFYSVFFYLLDEVRNELGVESIKKDFTKYYYKFIDLASIILKKGCRIFTSHYEEIMFTKNLQEYLNHYHDIVSYGNSYLQVLMSYISCVPPVYEKGKSTDQMMRLGRELAKKCLERGFEIAKNRIEDNIKNLDPFCIERIDTRNLSVIKLFLTPNSYVHKDILIKSANDDRLINLIDLHLSSLGLERTKNLLISEKLKTKFVYFSPKDEGFFYYKPREVKNSNFVQFGQQNPKNPYIALIKQGQMNLTFIHSDSLKQFLYLV